MERFNALAAAADNEAWTRRLNSDAEALIHRAFDIHAHNARRSHFLVYYFPDKGIFLEIVTEARARKPAGFPCPDNPQSE
jgi:hypothetical protein